LNVWVSVIAGAKDVSIQLKFTRANSARAKWIPVFVPVLLESFNKILQKLMVRMQVIAVCPSVGFGPSLYLLHGHHNQKSPNGNFNSDLSFKFL
jgi:hypothetical protein